MIIAVFFSFASCGKAPEETASVSVSAPASDTAAADAVSQSAAVSSSQTVPSSGDAGQGETVPAADRVTAVSSADSADASAGAQSAEPVTVKGGNYTEEIVSAELDTDYTGAQVIAVKFNFTNNGSESTCFGDVALVTVRQDGRTLNGESVIMDSNSFGGLAFNFRTQISGGTTIPCVYAYPYYGSGDIDVSLTLTTHDNARTTLGSGSATLSVG